MRLDHLPEYWCFSGSGLPMPVNGDSSIEEVSSVMRFIILSFPVFFHSCKSFKALWVNSISIDHLK